jgi:hypothetical protein
MAIALITSPAAAGKTWPLASGPLGRTGMVTDEQAGVGRLRALMA